MLSRRGLRWFRKKNNFVKFGLDDCALLSHAKLHSICETRHSIEGGNIEEKVERRAAKSFGLSCLASMHKSNVNLKCVDLAATLSLAAYIFAVQQERQQDPHNEISNFSIPNLMKNMMAEKSASRNRGVALLKRLRFFLKGCSICRLSLSVFTPWPAIRWCTNEKQKNKRRKRHGACAGNVVSGSWLLK